MTPPLPLLTRAQGARVRDLLHDRQVRAAERAFVVEGAKAVADITSQHPGNILTIIMTPGYVSRESASARMLRQALSAQHYVCPSSTFAKLSSLESPQGILAIVRQPTWDEAAILGQSTLLGIYGEQLQDPTNIGAMIRTAAALNVTALWLTPDSADLYNPKVVRSTSGMLLSLPVCIAKDLSGLLRGGCQVYAAEVSGQGTVSLCDIRTVPKKLILAFGNESRGLTEATLRAATKRFTIPLSRQVESLNVAATVAISTFYFRQCLSAS